MEMQNVLETNKLFTKNNQQYVIHYLRCSMILENVPLQKATQLCPDLPILVIAYSDGMVKARCCVPEVSYHFKCFYNLHFYMQHFRNSKQKTSMLKDGYTSQ